MNGFCKSELVQESTDLLIDTIFLMKYKNEDDKQPGWLKRVQEQSWEPELLISGLILFALFQTPDLIDLLNQHLEVSASDFFSNSAVNEAISALLKISVYVLIAGFITHIFLRSVWVAYAGLSYIYKDGINFSELSLPEMYTGHFNNHSYENRIKSLEKVCSGMFSASFLFFMIILGLISVGVIISLVIIFIMTLFPGFQYVDTVANILLISTGLLFLIDLLTLGIIRRIPYIRTLYYPFYKIGRLMMLAPMYEDIYYGFLSNNKKWKLGAISIFFCVSFTIAFMELRVPGTITSSYELSVNSDDGALLYHGHYEDRAQAASLGRSMIPSDIISGQVLRIFIPHFISNESNVGVKECLEKEPNAELSDDQVKLNCLNEIHQISVNDSTSSVKGLYQYNSKFDVNGLVYWHDISHLSRGAHILETFRWRSYRDTSFYQRIARIEFYKESKRLSE